MIGNPVFWVVYLLACALVGMAGRHRRIGFIGFFIFSLLLSPPLTLLILILTRPAPEKEL